MTNLMMDINTTINTIICQAKEADKLYQGSARVYVGCMVKISNQLEPMVQTIKTDVQRYFPV